MFSVLVHYTCDVLCAVTLWDRSYQHFMGIPPLPIGSFTDAAHPLFPASHTWRIWDVDHSVWYDYVLTSRRSIAFYALVQCRWKHISTDTGVLRRGRAYLYINTVCVCAYKTKCIWLCLRNRSRRQIHINQAQYSDVDTTNRERKRRSAVSLCLGIVRVKK